jgi:threonine/homoserine/homoserine lactone efflux protein
MLGALVTFFLVGLVAVVALGVILAVAGVVFSIAAAVAGFLLFKVAPIVLLGYLVVRFLRPRHKELSEADRKWLEE